MHSGIAYPHDLTSSVIAIIAYIATGNREHVHRTGSQEMPFVVDFYDVHVVVVASPTR